MEDKYTLFRFKTPNDFQDESKGHTSYVLKKPTRSMYDHAELFFAKEKANLMRDKLLTRQEVIKQIGEEEFYKDVSAKQRELAVLDNKGQKRTEDEQKRYNDLFQEILKKREQQDYIESANAELFESTVEHRAGKQTILWWIFFLSYLEGENGDEPFFKGETFQEKMQYYYDPGYIETTDHNAAVLRRFIHLITRWFYGLVTTQEEFESELQEEIEREKQDGLIPDPENKQEESQQQDAQDNEIKQEDQPEEQKPSKKKGAKKTVEKQSE